MDTEHRKPRTFVSTFRLDIKIPSKGFKGGRKKKEEEEEDKERRTLAGNNGVEAASATGRVQREKLMYTDRRITLLIPFGSTREPEVLIFLRQK